MAKRTTGARVYLSLIGLLLAGAGGLFTWLMWRSYDRAKEIESWPLAPCSILESRVAEEYRVGPDQPLEYRFEVHYAYDWEEGEYRSTRYDLRGSQWSKSSAKAKALVEKYPMGTVAECRVNPADPAISVLKTDSKAPGYSIWFPLIFVVGGLGVVVGAWRR